MQTDNQRAAELMDRVVAAEQEAAQRERLAAALTGIAALCRILELTSPTAASRILRVATDAAAAGGTKPAPELATMFDLCESAINALLTGEVKMAPDPAHVDE